MAWAKAPVAIGAATFAASLAIAGTLTSSIPAAQDAARQLEAKLKLTALSDIDAFSAIPAYLEMIETGNIPEAMRGLAAFDAVAIYEDILTALANDDLETAIALLGSLDSTSAIPLYIQALQTGNIPEAMRGLAAFGAVPVYEDIISDLDAGDVNAAIDHLGELESTSAVPVYRNILTAPDLNTAIDELGNLDSTSAVPVYRDILTAPTLEDAAIATGGLDSLSAVDTFFGDSGGGGGVFTGGGIDALAPNDEGEGGYAALSALPAYVDAVESLPLAATAAPDTLAKTNDQGVVRDSLSFKPKPLVLFGNPGDGSTPEEGMRGYGNFLKKLGLNGGPDAADPSGGGEGE